MHCLSADDVTMLVDNNRRLTEIRRIFTDFERISGARLNLNKTICIMIGNFHLPTWLTAKEQIKILGVYFEENQRKGATFNWNNVVNKVR
jgi:hypothetical protein